MSLFRTAMLTMLLLSTSACSTVRAQKYSGARRGQSAAAPSGIATLRDAYDDWANSQKRTFADAFEAIRKELDYENVDSFNTEVVGSTDEVQMMRNDMSQTTQSLTTSKRRTFQQ